MAAKKTARRGEGPSPSPVKKPSGGKAKAAKPRESTVDKKQLAKMLYERYDLTQKVLAERVGVTEKTIGKWIEAENWHDLKKSLVITKHEQLRLFYEQIANLNRAVMEGAGFPDSKQADTQKKLTASISDLETETNIGQAIDVGIDFTSWLSEDEFELSKRFVALFDAYIKDKLRKRH